MAEAYQRHDIFDAAWALLEPRLLGHKGVWGRLAHDNWRFNAVCWILRTGAPWRDLPPSYGDCKNTHRRFCRWRDNGAWEAPGVCGSTRRHGIIDQLSPLFLAVTTACRGTEKGCHESKLRISWEPAS